ncbi:MAG: hypothetical protein Q7U47_14870 [Paludibacter sp.]|nr:hypothetical protein [Paludibacter sp.]
MRRLTQYFSFFSIIAIVGSIFFTSCDDEIFSAKPENKLAFSTDTLSFDTVFTTIGSTTEKILIYNKNRQALKISSIKIAGGKNSSFRMNVDGSINADNTFENIEIPAKDSIYIFVEVTIDPNNSNSPVLIDDSIVFITNGNRQRIRLEAFGQNMILMKNKLIVNDTVLTAEKPYLIKGFLALDSAKTLTLLPGCKLYFHNNSNLVIYGNLKAEGTFEKPIELRGDRLDKIKFVDPVPYNYVAGQWGGVYLLWKGANHLLRHVNITSGYVGIYFNNSDRETLPHLEISHCRLHNFVFYGLVAQNGNVKVTNTEISNTGSFSVYLNGGKHTFIHATIANYYNNNSAEPTSRDKNPAVMIMNLNRSARMETIFQNCIITGTLENELSIASRFTEQYKGTFTNCFIRKPKPVELAQFKEIRWFEKNDTIVFKQARYDYKKGTYFNFVPDSVSPARGLANTVISAEYPIDLNGNSRLEDNSPDAGAYEWKPTKK